jgi:hypothetical protein
MRSTAVKRFSWWLRAPVLLAALLAVPGAAVLAHAATAEADVDAKAKAKAKLEQAARSMDAGDYEQALADFEEAYRLVQNPKFFFNIGLARVGLARHAEALRAFERFLAEAKTAPATAVEDAKKQIESLRPKVALVEVTAEQAGIEIVVDGRAQGKTPLAERVYVDPGEHRLLAQNADGTPLSVQVFSVVGGEQRTLKVVVPVPNAAKEVPGPQPAGGPGASQISSKGGQNGSGDGPAGALIARPGSSADEPERSLYKKPWFWGAVGAGVVAVGLTVLLVAGRSTTYPDPSLGTHAGD